MDTIFAQITGYGGTIVTFRISGPSGRDVIHSITDQNFIHRNATLCTIQTTVTQEVLDTAIITLFQAPNSFTGEDVIEVSLHGSRFIVHKFVSLLIYHGLRHAEPGEFSKRAVINQKIDLIQAEGLNLLIKSETHMQHKMSKFGLDGEISQKYNDIRKKIIKMMSLIEVNIDFSDELIPPETITEFFQIYQDIMSVLSVHVSNSTSIAKMISGIKIAIIGRPNVGKSSLLNALCRKDIAIVSNIPGTTRDAIEANLNIDGYLVTIIDTAGIHSDSHDVIEMEGIKRSLKHMCTSDFNLIIVDIDSGIEKCIDDINMYASSNDIICINKSDLIDDCDYFLSQLRKTVKNKHIINISTIQNHTIDVMLSKISEKIIDMYTPFSDPLILNERHQSILLDIQSVLLDLNLNEGLEVVAEKLRSAAYKIGQITGAIITDNILDSIFMDFCIGK